MSDFRETYPCGCMSNHYDLGPSSEYGHEMQFCSLHEAAEDLLAACKRFAACFDRYDMKDDIPVGVIEDVRAAIKKAEDGEP
jgi:hypothetical protein